mmetsp:Transcript_27268/g.41484  ORF Transcript_27268/g.41484 Transcript_27268/m.41484 type:complete len:87 (-) Transcript_27268:700-960(-)
MEEVNQFLHQVHTDLEDFLKRHKVEHTEMNIKIQKLSEVGHKTYDNIDDLKETVEGLATLITCLLEFSSIQQSLSYQSEVDKLQNL